AAEGAARACAARRRAYAGDPGRDRPRRGRDPLAPRAASRGGTTLDASLVPIFRHVACLRHVMDQRRRDALRRAAERLGDHTRLAAFLGVELRQLERWLAGTESAPQWAY